MDKTETDLEGTADDTPPTEGIDLFEWWTGRARPTPVNEYSGDE